MLTLIQTKNKFCGKLRLDETTLLNLPFDVVLTTKEYRSRYNKNSATTKVSTRPESTYYINPVCVLTRILASNHSNI
jgi:hypothetical protein